MIWQSLGWLQTSASIGSPLEDRVISHLTGWHVPETKTFELFSVRSRRVVQCQLSGLVWSGMHRTGQEPASRRVKDLQRIDVRFGTGGLRDRRTRNSRWRFGLALTN